MTIDDDKGRAKDDSWTEERDGTGCCWTSVTCSQWTLLSSKHGCCLIFSVMNEKTITVANLCLLCFCNLFFFLPGHPCPIKRPCLLSHLSQHHGSKYVGTTGLPLTHLQESAYFWSPPNELRPGLPLVPSGRTVVHITSCLGARWYIPLVVFVHGGTYH